MQVILSEPEVDRDEYEYELEKRTTAVFYSITSTQKGTRHLFFTVRKEFKNDNGRCKT